MSRNEWKIGFLTALIMSMSLSCDIQPPELPSPSPSTFPIPTSEPIRFGIYAPAQIPVNTPVVIVFCGKTFAKEVFADTYRLGYLGHNRASGCLQLVQPGFNTPGKRVIKIGNLEHSIEVFEFSSEL